MQLCKQPFEGSVSKNDGFGPMAQASSTGPDGEGEARTSSLAALVDYSE